MLRSTNWKDSETEKHTQAGKVKGSTLVCGVLVWPFHAGENDNVSYQVREV